MESLFILIPLSLILIVFIAWILHWAIKNDQFEDLKGLGESILMDDDSPKHP